MHHDGSPYAPQCVVDPNLFGCVVSPLLTEYHYKHMADKLNVSLEPHLRDALAALLWILPEETSQQLIPCLSSETNATVVPVIPYELILKISRWCQDTDGKAALQAYSPPLDPHSYTMVSLLAGTRTSPEKRFPPYAAKDPEEDRRLQIKDRKAIATLVNAVLSVVGTGVATWWASGHAGMRLEWVCGLSHYSPLVSQVNTAVDSERCRPYVRHSSLPWPRSYYI